MTTPQGVGYQEDMAKKQSRRSISLSRTTYERLRSYCETNGISMSQFVEHRVGDFLGRSIRPRQPSSEAFNEASPPPSAPPVAATPTATVAPGRPERRPAPAPTVPTPDRIFTF